MANEGAPSSFLHKIPDEIRLAVYTEVLRFDCPLTLDEDEDDSSDVESLSPGRAAVEILFVSKQIMSEALPILYEVSLKPVYTL